MDWSEPSPRQRDVLDFVMAHVDQLGFPPSLREIGAALGIESTNAVSGHVQRLVDLGFLRRVGEGRRIRSLAVTELALQLAAGDLVAVPVYGRGGQIPDWVLRRQAG